MTKYTARLEENLNTFRKIIRRILNHQMESTLSKELNSYIRRLSD